MPIESLLQDQVAIITGASQGIGRATALTFARAGASVVLAARSGDLLQSLAAEIKAMGGQALAIPTDVTRQTDVDHLLTLTLRAFRKIDILVNNAAVLTPIGKTWEVNPNAWRRLIDINVVGPYLCSRVVLPHMLERGGGRIINVSSGAAYSDTIGWNAYCTSKAALNRFSTILAAEVAQTHIAVSAMNPGTTDTPMQAEIRQTPNGTFDRADYFRDLHRQGRLYPPEEPAQLILWLASEFGQDQNGAILNLDNLAVREQIAKDLGLPLIPARKEA